MLRGAVLKASQRRRCLSKDLEEVKEEACRFLGKEHSLQEVGRAGTKALRQGVA